MFQVEKKKNAKELRDKGREDKLEVTFILTFVWAIADYERFWSRQF